MKHEAANATDTIWRNGLCTGCGLCASAVGQSKIKMAYSAQGWLRPVADQPLSAEDNDRVRSVCPGIRLEHGRTDGTYHPIWGPIVASWTGHATDPGLRHHASSGGALSAVLGWLLASDTVDRVVQIGVSETDPVRNAVRISRTADEVFACAGSRYAPSAPLEFIDAEIAKGGTLAFVGKPCDAAALRRHLDRNPDKGRHVPVILSFMCAGVPAETKTLAILDRFGVQRQEVADFRYRGDGWPGLARAVTRDGKEHTLDYNAAWGGILSRGLQFRCKICPDGIGELADIVCADAWECDEAGYPNFDERDGRSLILARTERGAAVVRACVEAGAVGAETIDPAAIDAMQPFQKRRKALAVSRLLALQLVLRPRPTYRGFHMLKAARALSPAAHFRSFAGTLRRILLRGEGREKTELADADHARRAA